MSNIKDLQKVNAVFEKYDCFLLGASIETIAESFGSSEYDEYWWHDMCYTKHFTTDFTLFMRLDTILEDNYPKVELKVKIKRHHYSASFDNLKEYFEIQKYIDESEILLKQINEELYQIKIGEVKE